MTHFHVKFLAQSQHEYTKKEGNLIAPSHYTALIYIINDRYIPDMPISESVSVFAFSAVCSITLQNL